MLLEMNQNYGDWGKNKFFADKILKLDIIEMILTIITCMLLQIFYDSASSPRECNTEHTLKV